jgi:type II secretory pathway component GspD/PulD (secretin)
MVKNFFSISQTRSSVNTGCGSQLEVLLVALRTMNASNVLANGGSKVERRGDAMKDERTPLLMLMGPAADAARNARPQRASETIG